MSGALSNAGNPAPATCHRSWAGMLAWAPILTGPCHWQQRVQGWVSSNCCSHPMTTDMVLACCCNRMQLRENGDMAASSELSSNGICIQIMQVRILGRPWQACGWEQSHPAA